MHISRSYLDSLRPLVDEFCLPEACLIADIIEHYVKRDISFDPSYIYTDVNKAVSSLHSTGMLHSEILKDLPRYLERKDDIAGFFNKLKDADKKASGHSPKLLNWRFSSFC